MRNGRHRCGTRRATHCEHGSFLSHFCLRRWHSTQEKCTRVRLASRLLLALWPAADPEADAAPFGELGSSDDSTRSLTRTAVVGGALRFLSALLAVGCDTGRAACTDDLFAAVAAAMGTPTGADMTVVVRPRRGIPVGGLLLTDGSVSRARVLGMGTAVRRFQTSSCAFADTPREV